MSEESYQITGSSPASPENEFLRKHFGFSRIDAAKLCAFPPPVIKKLFDWAQTASHEIKFEVLYKRCLDYCLRNNITMDYKWAARIEEYSKRQLAKGLK